MIIGKFQLNVDDIKAVLKRAIENDFFISDWLRNRNTVELLGIWEQIHNHALNYGEFAII
ncbi:KilA-N domain-containing protein [Sedimentibacter hydroxybenzoicus DSM 7310]|uniref:KilA-N domain-containing protein n=1 Tax=Sedimentibacter hydroxybenzoicus DSM 7310 TaxID=1123245 RepID=A0A974BI63_SEDHY|nr:KilA-N domain-containing protein [Sedimentibacter hydroxybenzoicus]NYB73635.1 KilA-N domain-containing protein [Sedimentibacter hydroxybenzoicus DSM 7310]